MFYNRDLFPFVRDLEAGFSRIKHEFDALSSAAFVGYPERQLYAGSWDVCGFYAFGQRLETARGACPQTASLIDAVPGLTTAGFSRLGPGTHIRPHTGYSDTVLRCHLGIVIPPDGCGIRVGPETRSWIEGQCLIFDDMVEHEAWNSSSSDRIVLLIDFVKSGLSYSRPELPYTIPHDF